MPYRVFTIPAAEPEQGMKELNQLAEGLLHRSLVGQRHFHGASTSERVPLLAVVNERTTRAGAFTTASSERHK